MTERDEKLCGTCKHHVSEPFGDCALLGPDGWDETDLVVMESDSDYHGVIFRTSERFGCILHEDEGKQS